MDLLSIDVNVDVGELYMITIWVLKGRRFTKNWVNNPQDGIIHLFSSPCQFDDSYVSVTLSKPRKIRDIHDVSNVRGVFTHSGVPLIKSKLLFDCRHYFCVRYNSIYVPGNLQEYSIFIKDKQVETTERNGVLMYKFK